MEKYDRHTISNELIKTALGIGYYGNALYVARDLPEITKNDIACINRWLYGTQTNTDHVGLQAIANAIRDTKRG